VLDLHSHILPGIDDGPDDIHESVRMARMAAKDGIRTIVATPHCFDGVHNCETVDIAGACLQLNRLLKEEHIDVEILPGAEIRLTPEMADAVGKYPYLALGYSRSLLIELPEMFVVEGVIRQLEYLQQKGFHCLIAHPERNSQLFARPEQVDAVVYTGAGLQLTAASLLGDFGPQVRGFSRFLLQKSAECCLATDSHCTRKRKPRLTKAVKIAAKIIGQERAQELVEVNFEIKYQEKRGTCKIC